LGLIFFKLLSVFQVSGTNWIYGTYKVNSG
jgi:hypothetical protein